MTARTVYSGMALLTLFFVGLLIISATNQDISFQSPTVLFLGALAGLIIVVVVYQLRLLLLHSVLKAQDSGYEKGGQELKVLGVLFVVLLIGGVFALYGSVEGLFVILVSFPAIARFLPNRLR